MILKNGLILDKTFKFVKADISVKNGIIEAIGTALPDESGKAVDCAGLFILPGFIDTHLHGAYGVDFCDIDKKFDDALLYEAKNGITALCPTTKAASANDTVNCIEHIVSEKNRNIMGAKICGIHLEGPFISRKYKGALNEEFIATPDTDTLNRFIAHGAGLIKIITLAPELPEADELIKTAVKNGITASMGHTDATLAQTLEAIACGATQSTHTFNAMRAYNHRESGILGAVLNDSRVKCEMICDFVHLNSSTINLIYKMKGSDKINVISDSCRAAGLGDGVYDFDGRVQYVENGVCKLEDGTISASCMTMLDGVKNLYSMGIPLEEISKMASHNPAQTLGIADRTGSIAAGFCADLVMMDKNLDLKFTFIDGECVYKA